MYRIDNNQISLLLVVRNRGNTKAVAAVLLEVIDRAANLEGNAATTAPEVCRLERGDIVIEHNRDLLVLHEEWRHSIEVIARKFSHVLGSRKSKLERLTAKLLLSILRLRVEAILVLLSEVQQLLRADRAAILRDNNDIARIVRVTCVLFTVLIVDHDHGLAQLFIGRGLKEFRTLLQSPVVVVPGRVRNSDRLQTLLYLESSAHTEHELGDVHLAQHIFKRRQTD